MRKATIRQVIIGILRARKGRRIEKTKEFIKMIDLVNHINDASLVTNHKDMPQRKRGSQTQLSTYVPINAYI